MGTGMESENGSGTEKGSLILVNGDHGYRGGEEDLVRFPGTKILLEKETAKRLHALLSTLPEGELVLVSG